MACVVLLAIARPCLAQSGGFTREIHFTTSAATNNIRRATVTYDPAAPPATRLTVTPSTSIATTNGADGLCFGPDGSLFVGGRANRIHRVNVATGGVTTLTAGSGAGPTVADLALDAGHDKLWAAGLSGQLSRIPVLPSFGAGSTFTLTGPDTVISDLAFLPGRVLYSSPGGAGGAGALGTINLTTFTTTRLITGLPAAAGPANDGSTAGSLIFDARTGHIIVAGNSHLTQFTATTGVPVLISDRNLATDIPGLTVAAAAGDGRGHIIGATTDGRLFILDFAETGRVATGTFTIAPFDTGGGTVRDIAPLFGPGAAVVSECLWDNGPFDGRDGQISALSILVGDARTADDFYLEPGSMYRLDGITSTLFSDSYFPSARIELYADCNGAPGELIAAYPVPTLTDTGQTFQGLHIFTVDVATPGLWLRGGKTYWVSVIGVGSLQGTDQWFLATAGNLNPRGKPGAFLAPDLGFPEWTSVADFGCGCTDFAFTIRGESCKVLHDNGPAPLPTALPPPGEPVAVPSYLDNAVNTARAADNFALGTCNDETACYIEAVIYTNCSPVRGWLELYANNCNVPTGNPLYIAPFSRVVDLGYSVTINGLVMQAFRVEFHNLGWFLQRGRNYWAAVMVQGSGTLNQRGYFALAAPCMPDGCLVQVSEAAAKGAGVGQTDWTPVSLLAAPFGTIEGRDLSFLIAVESPSTVGSSGSQQPACPADINRSGTATVQDLFDFLSQWFAGCP